MAGRAPGRTRRGPLRRDERLAPTGRAGRRRAPTGRLLRLPTARPDTTESAWSPSGGRRAGRYPASIAPACSGTLALVGVGWGRGRCRRWFRARELVGADVTGRVELGVDLLLVHRLGGVGHEL